MDFTRYDLNSDGFVTALELADATGTNMEDCAKPFRYADTNGLLNFITSGCSNYILVGIVCMPQPLKRRNLL